MQCKPQWRLCWVETGLVEGVPVHSRELELDNQPRTFCDSVFKVKQVHPGPSLLWPVLRALETAVSAVTPTVVELWPLKSGFSFSSLFYQITAPYIGSEFLMVVKLLIFNDCLNFHMLNLYILKTFKATDTIYVITWGCSCKFFNWLQKLVFIVLR